MKTVSVFFFSRAGRGEKRVSEKVFVSNIPSHVKQKLGRIITVDSCRGVGCSTPTQISQKVGGKIYLGTE